VMNILYVAIFITSRLKVKIDPLPSYHLLYSGLPQ